MLSASPSPASPAGHECSVDVPAILFVDDEARIRSAIVRTMHRHRVKVHAAESPDAARALLEHIDVQVVISDLVMPDEDGVTFLAGVRESHPRLQRILLTGEYSIEDVRAAINRAGVHRFITKPWNNKHLVQTVFESIESWAVIAERNRLLEVTTRQKEALLNLTADLEFKVAQRTLMLERASEAWRRTFDSIDHPLALVDSSLRVRRANLAAAALAHEEIRALIGRNCHEALFNRETPCAGCPVAAGELLDGRPVELRDNRSGRLWELTAWPMNTDSVVGGASQAVCHYNDVTESREMQRQFVALEKLAAVGELAGCVAHELNNPLTAITTFSQLLTRRVSEPFDEMAADILDQAKRCSRIVKSLLDYARPGVTPGRPEVVDVLELIGECVKVARFQLKAADTLELTYKRPDAPCFARGDVDGFKSLFLNLVTNAIQATQKVGEVCIEAAAADGGWLRVEVRDTGPGIPEHLIDQIFKPFFTTKAKNKGGTGLGLAIVSNVVKDHGGRVRATNAPSGGACFIVELPVVGETEQE